MVDGDKLAVVGVALILTPLRRYTLGRPEALK
jgi:hypothetical protein